MDLLPVSDSWPYWVVFIAAIIEGEVAYIAAAALVAQGQLNPVAVAAAGALGATIGDQAFFFALRGRLATWVARYPSLERKAAPLLGWVRRHDAFMILLIRFAPGLRIAIAVACAWVGVSAVRFSILSLLSAVVWAVALLVLVGWLGPTYLARFGLEGWKGALLAGAVVLGLFKLLALFERRVIGSPDAA